MPTTPTYQWAADSLSLNDGDLVGTWSTSGGSSSNDATNTGSARPTYKANIINGLPVVRFAFGQLLNLATTFNDSGDMTLVCVIKDGTSRMVALGGGAGVYSFYGTSSGNVYWLFRDDSDVGLTLTPTYSGFNVWSVKVSSGTATAYLNGTSIGSGSIGTSRHINAIGSRGGQDSDGDVAEIRYFNSLLSDAARQVVEKDVGTKYGISPPGDPARTATESVTVSGAVTRTLILFRAASEAVSASGSVTRVGSFSRSITASPTTSESAARAGTFTRTVTATPTTSESLTRIGVFSRAVTATPTTSESLTRIGVFSRAVTATPTTSESVTRTALGLRAVVDALTVTESLSRVVSATRASAEVGDTSESLIRTLVGQRATTDAPTTSELVTVAASATRGASDAPILAEFLDRVVTLHRSGAEAVSTSETALGVTGLARSAAESVETAESPSRNSGASRSAADGLTLADLVARVFTGVRSTVDSPTTFDTTFRQVGLGRSVADAPTLVDSAGGAVVRPPVLRFGVDTVGVSTSVIVLSQLGRQAVDQVLVADRAALDRPVSRTVINGYFTRYFTIAGQGSASTSLTGAGSRGTTVSGRF